LEITAHAARLALFLVQVAGQAGLGFLVHLRTDFRRIGRVDDGAVLAQNPDLADISFRCHVGDDPIDEERFVLQHRESRALDDRLG
jgi:hypothetical protein